MGTSRYQGTQYKITKNSIYIIPAFCIFLGLGIGVHFAEVDIPLKSSFCHSFIRADSLFESKEIKIASYSEYICGLYKNQISDTKISNETDMESGKKRFPFFNETLSNEVTLKFR